VVWSYIGMLLAARLRPQLTSAAPAERRPGPRDDVVEALVLGLLLATVTFAPLLQGQLATPEWAQNVPGLLGVAATYLVLGLFPLIWLLADAISPAGSTTTPWRAPLVRAGTVAALLALYGLGRALAGALGATLAFAAFLVAATLALAVSLWLSPDPGARLERPVWRVVAVGVLLAVSMWALALRPLIADVYISEGRRAASGKRWPEARADFAKALSLAPHQERYALFIAGADVELAQASPDGADVHLREALDLLQWASRVRPIDPAYHSRAALVYRSHAQMAPNEKLRQERLQQAVRFSEAALELSPRDPGLMADLGRSFQEMGDYQRAVEWFRRSLAHYELTLDTHMRLGDSLLELGEVAGARQAYCGAVELDADATIANRKEAVSSSGDDPHAHASLALLYSCAGRHQQAVAAALEARQLAPSDAVAGRVGELVERGMD
jgi:tetratricopeptide (TPR) repeat protein